MGTNHNHHSHTHSQENNTLNRSFFIAIVANGLFVISQIIFSYLANSTSLFADAIHNLGDVLGLIVAWIGQRFLRKSPTYRTTYGLKKTSILAALTNGILLVFSCGVIASDAVYKLIYPSGVEAISVMVVASIGIVVNTGTALLFMRDTKDLNIRSAFLHLIYDALISVGVVIAAALMYWTGWLRIDPLVGLFISVIIIKGTWSLFTDSFRLIIDGVPREISTEEVQKYLEQISFVKNVHHLHIWALSTKENALSVHLWMPERPLSDQERQVIQKKLAENYNIQHATIQVEQDKNYCAEDCG